jgi:hypothetical protein
VDLLVVVARPADEQCRVVVRVLKPELITVGVDLELARVGLARVGDYSELRMSEVRLRTE